MKVFVEEREMTVMIAVDLSESARFGTRRVQKAHVASEIAALLAFSAIRNNDRVGLLIGTNRLERVVAPKKGEKHVMRVVREILGYAPTLHEQTRNEEAPPRSPRGRAPLGAATDLKGLLEGLVGVARRRSVAFVVSDFLAEGYERALSLAAAKHDVVPVVLRDARDDELPDVGLASFQDLETGELVLVDTGAPEVRANYKKSMLALHQARTALFRKRGLDSVDIDTGGSFVRPLRDLFARRARRAHAMMGTARSSPRGLGPTASISARWPHRGASSEASRSAGVAGPAEDAGDAGADAASGARRLGGPELVRAVGRPGARVDPRLRRIGRSGRVAAHRH